MSRQALWPADTDISLITPDGWLYARTTAKPPGGISEVCRTLESCVADPGCASITDDLELTPPPLGGI